MSTDAVANQSISQRHMAQLNLISNATKPATPEKLTLNNPKLSEDRMVELVFENIGGQELINISRNDIIDGQDVIYSPIKNLKDLHIQYNPNNIIRLDSTSDTYFKNFPIRLENKLPSSGIGPSQEELSYKGTGPNGEIVYIDPTTGDLIINVVSLEPDEQVDVEILDAGEILNGTIYGEV
jgi:hypothetical protein